MQSPDRAALMAVFDASVLPLHSWPMPLPSPMHGPITMSVYSSLLSMKPPGQDQAGI